MVIFMLVFIFSSLSDFLNSVLSHACYQIFDLLEVVKIVGKVFKCNTM